MVCVCDGEVAGRACDVSASGFCKDSKYLHLRIQPVVRNTFNLVKIWNLPQLALALRSLSDNG